MVANARVDMSEVVASQVSVRDLKTHLSEWLGRVQAGEVVEVTSHRKPIARITADPRLAGALAAIMAAVVGVIANLSVWFAAHVFFANVGQAEFGPLRLMLPDPATLRLSFATVDSDRLREGVARLAQAL